MLNPDQRLMALLFRIVATGSGLLPEVLYGMWHHETEGGKSGPWTKAYNPGGIKARTSFFLTTIFGEPLSVRSPSEGLVLYARYPNEIVAAVALIMFLQQDRYKAALNQPRARMIKAIGDAGYVEHNSKEPANWIAGVTRWAEAAAEVK